MIVTLTLNPMLDKTVRIDRLRTGGTTRARTVEATAGGKGINVSRQLRCLGSATVATGWVAGRTGERILEEMALDGIEAAMVRTSGESREGWTVVEDDGRITELFEPPPEPTEGEVRALEKHVRGLLRPGDWLVCAGSSPHPAADGIYAGLCAWAGGQEVKVVVDSYGEALVRACGQHPWMVKVNRHELGMWTGGPLQTDPEVWSAMESLAGLCAGGVMVTDGAGPVRALAGGERWSLCPPEVRVVNAVGSGDTFLAGFLHRLSEGGTWRESLAWGVAAGSLNAAEWRVAAAEREEVAALAARLEPGVVREYAG
jgi:1-phosphofructokinase family hexose kinase